MMNILCRSIIDSLVSGKRQGNWNGEGQNAVNNINSRKSDYQKEINKLNNHLKSAEKSFQNVEILDGGAM